MFDRMISGGAKLGRTALALGAGLALMSQPLAAQDEMSDDDIFGALSAMMETEPLTEEQLERLPLAETIVEATDLNAFTEGQDYRDAADRCTADG